MAHFYTKPEINNENQGLVFPSSAKQFSARKHSTKKQAFGELKNVLHNHGDATPFRGFGNKGNVLPGPQKTSLCVDVLRKQQLKQNFAEAQKQIEKKLKPSKLREKRTTLTPATTTQTSNNEDSLPFEDLELPVNTCTSACNKTIEEIWSEVNMIDDEFLTKIIDGDPSDSESDETIDDFLKLNDGNYGCEEPLSVEPDLAWNSLDPEDGTPLLKFDMPEHSDPMMDEFF